MLLHFGLVVHHLDRQTIICVLGQNNIDATHISRSITIRAYKVLMIKLHIQQTYIHTYI